MLSATISKIPDWLRSLIIGRLFCLLSTPLRSSEARTLESLDQAMAEVVNYITEDDAFGWFNHCGLFT